MIEYTHQDGVAVLTMAHGRVNAMDLEFCQALSDRFSQINSDGRTRAVALTGTGSTFSAGVDLQKVVSGGMTYLDDFLPALDQVFRDVLSLELPVVVALNGHAIGGGAVLAACGDLVVAGPQNSRIGLPELSVGVPLPFSALEALRLTLGDATAATILDARVEPLSESPWSDIVRTASDPDRPLDTAIEIAATLTASADSGAFAMTKAQLRAPALQRIHDSTERHLRETRDVWEKQLESGAITRFLDKISR